MTKDELVVEELKKHFETLLNKTPPTPPPEEINIHILKIQPDWKLVTS